MITYRKTQRGDWVAFGPQRELKVGPVTVTKKDGTTKQEVVTGLGQPFDVKGVPHVYGYLKPKAGQGGAVCAECGKGGRLVADMEDGQMKHYSCCDMPPA